ncbi:Aspartate racemase [Planococcus massiliensis]|uniref:Aspartate racemase n=1 Tax=Planococcus massiliensis TaxID=1499687 RepID=A0A098EGG6_9BACL|nr:amino acid racemase [Planococcus massiliensis]CEG21373.1 Aspartate racemase [Planococcus massiliensis]
MKTLGLIGGTGPESTVEYYQAIISKFQEKSGDSENLPEFLINSINMYKIFELLENGRTEELTDYLAAAIHQVERAGADFAVLAANTPHIVFDQVQSKVKIPLISIVEETAEKTRQLNIKNVGLLGTKFTMENNFFVRPFEESSIQLQMPNEEEQQYIHEKIVKELEKGIVEPDTKERFLDIVAKMEERDGIEGIILGCTELPMIIKPEDTNMHQLNTTDIHVDAIVAAILEMEK